MIFEITILLIVFILAYAHISWQVESGRRMLDIENDARFMGQVVDDLGCRLRELERGGEP